MHAQSPWCLALVSIALGLLFADRTFAEEDTAQIVERLYVGEDLGDTERFRQLMYVKAAIDTMEGKRRARKALVDALMHEHSSRRKALSILAEHGLAIEELRAEVFRLLEHADREIRCDAIRIAGLYGDEAGPVLPALLEAIQSDDAKICRSALKSISMIGITNRAVSDAVLASVLESNEKTKSEAVDALVALMPPAEWVAPALRQALLQSKANSSDFDYFRDTLARIVPDDYILFLLLNWEMSSRDPILHTSALYHFSRSANPQAYLRFFDDALTDDNVSVRTAAVVGLLRSNPRSPRWPAVASELLNDDSSPFIPQIIAFCVSRSSERNRLIPAFGEVLGKELELPGVIEAVANYGPSAKPLIPQLARHLRSQHRFLRCAAAKSLGAVDAERTVKASIRKFLEEWANDPSSYRIHETATVIDTAMVYNEQGLVVRELGKLLADGDHLDMYFEGLTKFGPESIEALPVLQTLLSDPSRDVRWKAAKTLGAIGAGAARAVPALRDRSENDSDLFVRWHSLEALTKIGPHSEGN